MVGTKIALPKDGRHKNNSPKGGTDGEFFGRYEKKLAQLMDGTKITRQRDGQRESLLVDTEITC